MPLPDALYPLEGRWHLVASTFPLWLKGDRRQPCFNYRVIADGPHWALDDCVTWRKDDHVRSIRGISRPRGDDATRFTWRGRGWLRPLRSDWEIFHPDAADTDTAVVVFDRTLFTPAGADVITRAPDLAEARLHEIATLMRQHPRAAAHVEGLLRLPR